MLSRALPPITGQDGAFPAKFLLGKGYTVHGVKRQRSSFNTERIDHLYIGPQALLLKAHRARIEGRQELELWSTGAPRREFLYVDDLTDALVYVMKTYSGEETQNVGADYDVTIAELAQTIMRVVGLAAQLRFDVSKPDGTPQKLMDSGRLQKMGWRPTTSLEEGVRKLYASFLQTELAVS